MFAQISDISLIWMKFRLLGKTVHSFGMCVTKCFMPGWEGGYIFVVRYGVVVRAHNHNSDETRETPQSETRRHTRVVVMLTKDMEEFLGVVLKRGKSTDPPEEVELLRQSSEQVQELERHVGELQRQLEETSAASATLQRQLEETSAASAARIVALEKENQAAVELIAATKAQATRFKECQQMAVVSAVAVASQAKEASRRAEAEAQEREQLRAETAVATASQMARSEIDEVRDQMAEEVRRAAASAAHETATEAAKIAAVMLHIVAAEWKDMEMVPPAL